jgi:hypothetical protein
MTIVSTNQQRARKQHMCCSCQELIVKGESYTATFITDGGDAWTWKEHVVCHKIGSIRIRELDDWGDGVSQGWLNDDMQDAGYTDKNEYLKHLELRK